MKVLLVGGYLPMAQESMTRFADMLQAGLTDAGHDARLVRPPVWVGRLHASPTGLGKWIGYIDRFILYPALLRRQVGWADVVHLTDHGSAVYLPHLRAKPHVVTCHDALAIRAARGEIPQATSGWTGRMFQRWILRSLSRVQLVACVSRQTYADVERLTGLGPGRLALVHSFVSPFYRPIPAPEAARHLNALELAHRRPYLLNVSHNGWYKNRPGLLRMFARLVERPGFEQHQLVVTGQRLTRRLRELAETLGLGDRVLERPGVSDEQLRALYCTADALLFPSLGEGFGAPIVEAQSCGCPVVTTGRPPMTEIGGDAAIYVDIDDEEEAARVIADGLADRQRWRAAGFKNAPRFSAAAMIAAYVESYRRLMAPQT